MALAEPLMSNGRALTKDGKQKFCELCNVAFSMSTRRHHCRNCNKTVCSKCSKEKNSSGERSCYSCKTARIDSVSGFPGEEDFRSSGKAATPIDKSPLEEAPFPGEKDLSNGGKNSVSKDTGTVVFPGEEELRGSMSSTSSGSQVKISVGGPELDCMLCHVKFGPITRRHHCRKCNRAICARCWDPSKGKLCNLCLAGAPDSEEYRKRAASLGLQVEFEQGASKCNVCKQDFTWKRKRHHCRACGKTVCNDCSKHSQKQHAEAVPSRVCDNCYINSQSCSWCRMSKRHRTCGFWLFLLLGVAMVAGSAFDFGSFVGRNPQAFGAVYGTGNALVLLSTLFLWGPRLQAKRICSPKRSMTPFLLYFISLGVTVGLVIGLKNPPPVFVIICMCVQLLALVWYCLSLQCCNPDKKTLAST